ncbi:transposase [Paraburkholderia xenovorans]|nr:transposase [Paraburkholderia xenovorans]
MEERREPNGADWHEADPSFDLGSPFTGMADPHNLPQGVTRMDLLPLSDEAWQQVSHLFPYDPKPRFGRPSRNPREILDAILWVVLQDDSMGIHPPYSRRFRYRKFSPRGELLR